MQTWDDFSYKWSEEKMNKYMKEKENKGEAEKCVTDL